MLALGLQRISLFQKLIPAHTHGRADIGDNRFSPGDSSGFIQGYKLHPAGCLQGLAGLEQYAVAGTQPIPHHDCNRGCQTQGTGAGNNQHRDSPGQGEAQALPGDCPAHGDQGSDYYYGRHEDAGYFVCNPCYRGLGGCRIGYHFYYLAKGGVFANPGSLTLDVARLVYCGGADPVAGDFVYRD